MKRHVRTSSLVLAALLLTGCLGIPEGIEPVQGFDGDRYLGRWYEIARLDHSFERGMSNVTATYSLREDGGIAVANRGYLDGEGVWEAAEGRAYFVGDPGIGHLKVSFFGPFFASYVVFELDHEDYSYAFVSGPGRSNLWFLSRSPDVAPDLLQHFIERAGQLGFATGELIFPSHERAEATAGAPP